MKTGKRIRGFFLLQNMMLKDFVREASARQALGREEVDRLCRLEALNAAELERWEQDLFMAGDQPTFRQRGGG
ncbi:MAG: hypothetical protein H2050_16930 [Sphingobium sp.]|jgi:hypothetical protein|uniref:hypothetical protein n=1 Tax=Sphingomonadales TaxID=204457 RepID=UPI000872DD06|nr:MULTISPECIES: hypothetical protein [Sphingomonadaceae]MBA4756506.1 hypothetical protein [Sphingobium sp.]OJY54016.1 MAG: hypothetical protein BGP17_12675 [Sphingomonas sp. 67-41]RQW45834.1 hypothetical protein EH199_00145 [Novosphingobium sp. LASN5T]VVT17194.1 conserved hypothetical protein [Sphingomonas sp. EC-HK361]|tara:strand:+ start:1218 stop:1436 length:219 start_codon:yes stop_codon:yes gene_type:complete